MSSLQRNDEGSNGGNGLRMSCGEQSDIFGNTRRVSVDGGDIFAGRRRNTIGDNVNVFGNPQHVNGGINGDIFGSHHQNAIGDNVNVFGNAQHMNGVVNGGNGIHSSNNNDGNSNIFALCGFGSFSAGNNGQGSINSANSVCANVNGNGSNAGNTGNGSNNPWNRILYAGNTNDTDNVLFPITSTKI